ncbi:type IV pilus modification PilV family protein [Methylotuvimicrobium alcaliphilum]|uniref:Uncharacterized protein n=1 Tax=Methylotuvimicrobium alcaliphilum (strain DSM 19304 / NCIMB 14124 / VKM B-2133 / 20Z) TaxID=1091494 RepID=G4SVG2_META2|nr:hypothetical protein [Methylotuvimicrobium alcaliphilum]CCE22934.1 protein of unknown function [Methylotuvimicrobium alcaliphilum 20Z]
MKLNYTNKNIGIGLIEVLITTVVVAMGLLALATFQGELMGGSRLSKARDEAKMLCDSKVEELRDRIIRGTVVGGNPEPANSYLAIASGNDQVTGTNATFTRTWNIEDLVDPVRKRITATCSWDSEQVVVQSMIAFTDLTTSMFHSRGNGDGAGGPFNAPSLTAESSEDISKRISLPNPQTPGSLYTDENGDNYIVDPSGLSGSYAEACDGLNPQPINFENGLRTRRVNEDGVAGLESIELFEVHTINNADLCVARVRFNGGVIIPLRGTVHSRATTGTGQNVTILDVELFTFNISESGTYCVFKPAPGDHSAPYTCYVGGNCTFGPAGIPEDVTQCPDPAVAQAKVGPGGWRGRVGLLGVATQGRNICFAEEVAGEPVTRDTARNYYTRNGILNEGINKPYACHDFLIIDGQPNDRKLHEECQEQASQVGGLMLASKDIMRVINGPNVYDPVIDISYCTEIPGETYTIQGSITNAAYPPVVKANDGQTQVSCETTETSYNCTIKTIKSFVDIVGIFNNEEKSCVITLDINQSPQTGCALNFTTTTNPIYVITGNIEGSSNSTNLASLDVAALGEGETENDYVRPCTIGDFDASAGGRPYECKITTAKSSVTLTARPAFGFSVSPIDDIITGLTGSAGAESLITGPDFLTAVLSTHTVGGSITLESNVNNIDTVSVNIANASCTVAPPNNGWAQNRTGNYSCQVYAGNNSMTFAIPNKCSARQGNTPAKDYILSTSGSVTASSTGTGALTINLGNVTSNVTQNFTVTLSNIDCSGG